MMTLLVVAAMAVQESDVAGLLERAETAERSRRTTTARVEAEIAERFEESSIRAAGTLTLKVEGDGTRKLAVVLKERGKPRTVKTLVAGDEVVIHTGCPAFGSVWDLTKKEEHHPFDLWRRGLSRALLEDYEIALVQEEPAPVPEGKAAEPAVVKRPAGAGRAAAAEGGEGGAHVLSLVPKNEKLREAILSVRVHLNKGTFRIDRMEVETPLRVMSYALEDVTEPECVDESIFELDLWKGDK